MEREEELEQTIDELNYRLTNALKKIDRLKSNIKQAREEIENEVKFWSEPPKTKLLPSVKAVRDGKVNSYKHCLEILDNLIAESEGANG